MREGKKRGAERTQIATRNEEWSDGRLRGFLKLLPPAGMPQEYAILLKAYRGMTADLFARFIPFFIEAGKDINVKLKDGSTFLDHVSEHRKSAEYAAILEGAGGLRSTTLDTKQPPPTA